MESERGMTTKKWYEDVEVLKSILLDVTWTTVGFLVLILFILIARRVGI